ncbi:hypothetical protein COT77_01795 [Candidatus Berkelbacteria bacterium CG10_big_fil_rev_8_21_14_0_10_41_12]|uniref:Uncharacterized protein n=1 Tax=Candidatus Berkelbacteria bacterium CG10_big_fil_rev_8_21_14_0_10_41_12 TaxID=1974513 RepID=A0A2M6WXC0_9BACT|nr:MAG: hypothetical protein COT77_01795 [Candidatus Berkelbacteria bacterium CG10_big_fil_rev_8_21_14_0_10_41_12]
MIRNRKTISLAVAGILAISVLSIGILGYSSVGADTVLPGYATAHIHMEVTIPDIRKVQVRAVFTPEQGKKFYFKERDFSFIAPGLNTVEWYIRKIPEGTFTFSITSPSGAFDPSTAKVTLTANKVNDVSSTSINLGTPTPAKTLAPQATSTSGGPATEDYFLNDFTDNTGDGTTATATPGDENSRIPTPPVPGMPEV